jgi:hypothetical protein
VSDRRNASRAQLLASFEAQRAEERQRRLRANSGRRSEERGRETAGAARQKAEHAEARAENVG